MFLYPNNPVPVDITFLQRIDKDPPGRWFASAKLDGWRRIITHEHGLFIYRAKPAGSGELKPMPASLIAEFEALPWPNGITLDCEWIGNRMIEHKPAHALHVFDLLEYDMPFVDRETMLRRLFANPRMAAPHIHRVEYRTNPGLMDMFCEQLTDPLSEGLVIRRADSKIIGHPSRCQDNPHVLKVKYREVRELKGHP